MADHCHVRRRELFEAVIDLPVEQRARFLDDQCGTDEALRAELERLIQHDEHADPTFLASPIDPLPSMPLAENGDPEKTQAAEPRAWPVPRHVTIEGYEIIRELHRGGQGIVFEALQKSTKRKVAIKVLLEGRLATPSARRRFQREVALAAGLSHPNIVAVFDSGETPDGYHFCVMDYVRGRSIAECVREGKASLEDVLELFARVCDAVHYAHTRGVIHRDLKPSNILVDTDGTPRVVDFGLAKQLFGGTESLVSMTGQVMGTLDYMSPEQTRANPDEIDARSDVYSLGVVLYELLTGRHPYPVKVDMASVLKHITETEPTPPSKAWTPKSGVSQRKLRRGRPGRCPIDLELQTILLKALSKERERRYQSADALRQDILRYLQGKPIEAKRDSSLYVLRKAVRRHRAKIAVSVAFIVVAVGALSVGLRARIVKGPTLATNGPNASLAVLPLNNLSGDPNQEYFADGMTGELITTLGKIKALKVIAHLSVMPYKDANKSVPEISRELGVDALVGGTVAVFGDRARINISLISGVTAEQLWSNSYERNVSDVLAMQGEIARAISREIQVTLTAGDRERLTVPASVNPDAYRAYLRAMNIKHGRVSRTAQTASELQLQIRVLQRAIELDPSFALAQAALADAHTQMFHGGHDSSEERKGKAKAAVDAALALAPDLPEAHLALGVYYYGCHRDYDRALQEFAIAEQGLPNDSRVLFWNAIVDKRQGRFEAALERFARAAELDPQNPESMLEAAVVYKWLRQYPEATRHFERTIAVAPDSSAAYYNLVSTYLAWDGNTRRARAALDQDPRDTEEVLVRRAYLELLDRNYKAALKELASLPDFAGDMEKSYWEGLIYHLMGDSQRARTSFDAARVVLEAKVKERPDDSSIRRMLGLVYAGLGRRDDAVREGELAIRVFPASKDYVARILGVNDLALIYTLVSDYDDALDQIEYLLSVPSSLSVPLLRLEPRWDPLRDNPRYKELLHRYGSDSGSEPRPPDPPAAEPRDPPASNG